MGKLVDLTGMVFGRLTVISRGTNCVRRDGRTRVMWNCRCSCGESLLVLGSGLRSGHSRSCGCFNRDCTIERLTKHGHTAGMRKSGTFISYMTMLQRCLNPRASGFDNYGGRGITVCDRWIASFENFLIDMGEREDGTTLDRVNVNGNYEPLNCRWASNSLQGYNQQRRKTNTSGRTGVSFHKASEKWRASIKVNKKEIYLGIFNTFGEAVLAREKAEMKYFGFIKE